MRRLMFVFAAASLLASCRSEPSSAGPSLTDVEWHAVSVGNKAVPHPERVTASFTSERVGGRAACNQYSGPVAFGDGVLKVGPLISTKMACMEPGVMPLESAFLTALQEATHYSIDNQGKLNLTGERAAIVFVPIRRNPAPDNQN